jgi:TetR/AcrR family hemagglutinin/protease transcriptional regulator
MAKRAARARLSRPERRAQLLRQAIAVFARRGLGEARHTEIAKRAGVSVPTVFFYFETRTALVDAVLGEIERFMVEMAEEIHARDLPALDVLRAHVHAFTDAVDADPDHVRVFLDWSTAIRGRYWPRYIRMQERLVEVIARTLRRGQADGSVSTRADAEDEARLLVSSAHMLAQMKFTGVEPAKLERFVAALLGTATGA